MAVKWRMGKGRVGVEAAAGTEADGTPCRRITLPKFSRQPQEFFFVIFTATAKKPAHLPASCQTVRESIAGEHADVLRVRRAAAPATSTRCVVAQLRSREGRVEHGQHALQQRLWSPRHHRGTKSASKRTPNHPLALRSSLLLLLQPMAPARRARCPAASSSRPTSKLVVVCSCGAHESSA